MNYQCDKCKKNVGQVYGEIGSENWRCKKCYYAKLRAYAKNLPNKK